MICEHNDTDDSNQDYKDNNNNDDDNDHDYKTASQANILAKHFGLTKRTESKKLKRERLRIYVSAWIPHFGAPSQSGGRYPI